MSKLCGEKTLNKKQLKNKTVLITGASSGIGAALARAFAGCEVRLILTARRETRLKTLEMDIKNSASKILAIRADVTKSDELNAVREKTHQTFGPVDIVIANAAIPMTGKFEALSLADYRLEFETNIFGLLQTCYTFLDDLKQTKGVLVLIGSTAAYLSSPGSSAYAMSKFAVRAFAEAIRTELAVYGITVVLISPGFVKSELRHKDNKGIYHADSQDWAPTWLVMDPDKAAGQIIRAILKGRREKFITWHGYFGYWFRQYTPWLYFSLIERINKQFRQAAK
jgi:short-subunit dehydrogenase